MEWWIEVKDWFMGLGERYNANPVIFGSIYLGAIPFFFASIAWLVKNIKNKKPVFMPVVMASFFFVSAYLYLIIVGRNIPAWVYIFIILVMVYGVISTIKKVKKQNRKRHLSKIKISPFYRSSVILMKSLESNRNDLLQLLKRYEKRNNVMLK